jgi:hypothetical protein
MPGLGEPDHAYVDWLADRIAAAVPALATAATPVASEAPCSLAINRRLRRFMIDHRGIGQRVAMAPNPNGPRDDVIRMIRFQVPAGRPQAIVWSYACHPNAYPVPHAVSADYPGVVRERLREEFGPIPVLFLQGFSGDLRPPFFTQGESVFERLSHALRGPRFRRPSLAEWQAWAGGISAVATAAAQASGNALHDVEVCSSRVSINETSGPRSNPQATLVWHVIEAGDWKIVGVNAEPVVAYREAVVSCVRNAFVMTCGCIDDSRCYLPTAAMLSQGGYEVTGFCRAFAFTSHFTPETERNAIASLMAASGRSQQTSIAGSRTAEVAETT